MYFSQLFCYIECCHRTVSLLEEDGAVLNISLRLLDGFVKVNTYISLSCYVL